MVVDDNNYIGKTKMNDTPLLEILIGTYGRPLQAIEAVKSCLLINDQRIRIVCHSNGPEEKLEFLRNVDPRLKYGNFDENRGPRENWKKLISESTAKYCMLLSDEDRVNSNYFPTLLNWLDNNEKRMSAATCAVFDEVDHKYYYKHKQSEEFYKLRCTIFSEIFLHSYISGYIFNRRMLKFLNLHDLYKETIGNSYPHINMSHELLQHGLIGIFDYPLILKGIDYKVGGDSYGHLTHQVAINIEKNCKYLNPKVYGAYARGRGFYYMHNKIREVRKPIVLFSKIKYDLFLIRLYYNFIQDSNSLTGDAVDYFTEIEKAKRDAIQNGEFYNNLISQNFHKLFKYYQIEKTITLFTKFKGFIKGFLK